MEDAIVRLVDMPTKIRGMTALDNDGNYNVYVNHKYDQVTQLEVLKHEMKHIKNNHFYKDGMDIKDKEGD